MGCLIGAVALGIGNFSDIDAGSINFDGEIFKKDDEIF
jgi:hypothetical protein